jgi:hypothetical protein
LKYALRNLRTPTLACVLQSTSVAVTHPGSIAGK